MRYRLIYEGFIEEEDLYKALDKSKDLCVDDLELIFIGLSRINVEIEGMERSIDGSE